MGGEGFVLEIMKGAMKGSRRRTTNPGLVISLYLALKASASPSAGIEPRTRWCRPCSSTSTKVAAPDLVERRSGDKADALIAAPDATMTPSSRGQTVSQSWATWCLDEAEREEAAL